MLRAGHTLLPTGDRPLTEGGLLLPCLLGLALQGGIKVAGPDGSSYAPWAVLGVDSPVWHPDFSLP